MSAVPKEIHKAYCCLLSCEPCPSQFLCLCFVPVSCCLRPTIQSRLGYTCQWETDNTAWETQHQAHLHSSCTDHICWKTKWEEYYFFIFSWHLKFSMCWNASCSILNFNAMWSFKQFLWNVITNTLEELQQPSATPHGIIILKTVIYLSQG